MLREKDKWRNSVCQVDFLIKVCTMTKAAPRIVRGDCSALLGEEML